MKYQVRKNIFTNKWEAQTQEAGTTKWRARSSFATKEEAVSFLEALQKAEKKPKASKSKTAKPKKKSKV